MTVMSINMWECVTRLQVGHVHASHMPGILVFQKPIACVIIERFNRVKSHFPGFNLCHCQSNSLRPLNKIFFCLNGLYHSMQIPRSLSNHTTQSLTGRAVYSCIANLKTNLGIRVSCAKQLKTIEFYLIVNWLPLHSKISMQSCACGRNQETWGGGHKQKILCL